MDLNLGSAIQYVPGVGPVMAKRLERLEIYQVTDLLNYPPRRYNDFSNVCHISQVRPGDTVTIGAEIKSIINFKTKSGKRMQTATVFDESGKIEIIWFNQVYLLSILRPGTKLNIAGTVNFFGKKIAIMSPDYEIVADNNSESFNTGRLVPVYSETEGVSSKWLRARIGYLLRLGLHRYPDQLPDFIKQSYDLSDVSDAIAGIHFPINREDAKKSLRRLSFDELFQFQLALQQSRRIWEATQIAPHVLELSYQISDFITSLPFHLTEDQQNSITEIFTDMKRHYPMNRLLEGDVGSGKTVVAAVCMYAAHISGYRSILMAPTQILAEQHYETIKSYFDPYQIKTELITGNSKSTMTNRTSSKKSKNVLEQSLFPVVENTKNSSIFIGTHALLSQSVTFKKVGLVVIDEQQRFGVAQRKLIAQKGNTSETPHLLSMTATPIPRTIALSLWGSLDISIIKEMPKGRARVKTWVVPRAKRENAYNWIRHEITSQGTQAFIVCPLISESAALISVKSVKAEYDRLQKDVFPDLRLALLHGRLKPTEKNKILTDFRNKKFDVLITTPVVEVGIDIPDATIMMIEDSERFGLSALHQLRGRVGRRDKQSYCLLFTQSIDEGAIRRLKSLETVHNGPQLAEIDLAIRGPGELFGTLQHGLPNLKYADILDIDLVKQTYSAALEILKVDPELSQYPLLRSMVEKSTIISSSALD